jgi:ABC-type transporter Mla MlaB component
MINFELQEEDSNSTLIVNGQLTIACATEFKDALIKLYESSKSLFLDLANVSSIDTSCLQLLCAVHKSSMNSDKTIEIKDEFPESFKQSVTDAGYIRKGNCNANYSSSCFWVNDKKSHL